MVLNDLSVDWILRMPRDQLLLLLLPAVGEMLCNAGTSSPDAQLPHPACYSNVAHHRHQHEQSSSSSTADSMTLDAVT